MKTEFYTAVAQDELSNHGDDVFRLASNTQKLKRWKSVVTALITALLASLTVNALLIQRQFFGAADELPSKYAHLHRNVPTEIVAHNHFDSLNRTIQDAAWNNRDVEPWNGFLALDENYTIAQGLPHAQRWPWDLSKGVYILTSAHELHCVRILRIFVNENHDSVPQAEQTWQYPHVMHCLNVLRESVMCNADDTPLYTGQLHKQIYTKDPKAGIGTIKMCRDWNQLLAWSHARSACYRPINWGEEGFDETERYKFCPDGAKPWEKLRSST